MTKAPKTDPRLKVERWPIEKVEAYAKNARLHSPAQIDSIAASIKQFGFVNPCLVDADGVLIAGHGRVLASKKLGATTVPVIRLGHLSEDQVKALRIADNSIPLQASWDSELIRAEIGELKLHGFDIGLLGFPEVQLRAFGITMGTEGAVDPEVVPERPKKPVVRKGDLWVLGDHRLLCGDSTSKDDVAKCIGDVKPHLMVTDPPYGVKLDPTWRDRAGVNTLGASGKGGENYMDSGRTDTEARWDEVWRNISNCVEVFYVWCAGSRLVEVYNALGDADFITRQILIWDKTVLTLTRSNYWWTHEHCLYGVKKGCVAHWVGKAGQGTVWPIPSPKHIMSGSKEKNEPHPAQKPIECMKRPIENNSRKGDFVYEPFCGSGTTIIAAEMTGRRALAIELDPVYVQVGIERWMKFCGKQAMLDGVPFEQVARSRRKGKPNASGDIGESPARVNSGANGTKRRGRQSSDVG